MLPDTLIGTVRCALSRLVEAGRWHSSRFPFPDQIYAFLGMESLAGGSPTFGGMYSTSVCHGVFDDVGLLMQVVPKIKPLHGQVNAKEVHEIDRMPYASKVRPSG